jgi:hypothetical protein
MGLRRARVLSSMATILGVLALVVLSPVAATAAGNVMQRPVIGIANGTTTVSLITGAGTTVNHGYLLGIGLFTGSSNSTFAYTSPNTFSSTGTGTLITASGNELFVTTSGTGTLNGTAVTATTVDTITGGTGPFEGVSGRITITARGTSASTVGSTETFTTVGIWIGTISHPVVSLADLASSSSFTGSASFDYLANGCSFAYQTFDATYPGSESVGPVTLDIAGCADPFTTMSFSGLFTISTNIGTLTGTASGPVTLTSGTGGSLAVLFDLTLKVVSGTGSFAGTTGTLQFATTYPSSAPPTFSGTVTAP